MTGGGIRALLTDRKRSFWLVFGGIWLAAGVIMLVVGIGMALDERRWGAAVETTGIVLTKDIVPADSDSSTEYRVGFRYTTDSGATAEGDQRVDVHAWEALTERGPIRVFYLPGSSEPARLDPTPDPFGPVIFLVAGMLLAVVGGFLVVRTVRNLLRADRLMRTGTATDATVSAVEQTNVSFNRRPQFRVRYAYRDGRGTSHEGDSGYLEWTEASSYDEGDTVRIRYDPARPADSVLLGRALVDADVAGAPTPPASP
jgi:hypothetical protein